MPEDTIKDDEYAPITQELREYIERHPTMMHAVGLTDLCDNIDAIHKSLEEQNAKLREKVLNQRKQLAEVQEAIERRNNGVLKRRWQKKMDALKNENEEMRNFNYRMREAIRRHEDLTLWGRDYTELPLDADGVPIYIGDMLAEGGANPEKVESLMLDCDGWNVNFGLGWCVVKYHKWHHVKPDTWENIIEDALGSRWAAPDELSQDFIALVARCKALAGEGE